MMKKIKFLSALVLSFSTPLAFCADKPIYYGPALCVYPEYECHKVVSGESWEKLFSDEYQRDLVQRINRSYNNLWPGKEIAIPRDLAHVNLLDISPFPTKIKQKEKEKQVIVDQEKLAWAAYDVNGKLVKWGPVSSGSDKCSDNSSPTCRSLTGIFRVFSKESSKCTSDLFPLGKGGAKMPYCMYFHKGVAMHGSTDIPGYRASHGCIRMFTQDAKWLNENFVELSSQRNNQMGTKVVVRPLQSAESKS
jgi:hypothetical protein